MSYEMETTFTIYSNDGFFYEVGHDADGLGNIELRYFEDKTPFPQSVVVLAQESLPLVIKALSRQLEYMKGKES